MHRTAPKAGATILFAFPLLLAPSSPLVAQPAATAVDVTSILAETADLTQLTRLPDPAFVTRQASSYDRASTSPDDAKTWFANADVGQYVRTERREGRDEHVMMDEAGPGAIVRIWSANPAGTLRIYLDGSDAPALEAKMSDLLGGKHPGLPAPLGAETSKGWNLYFPIPYARHCKVTLDGKDPVYYHVNFRTYPSGTAVRSFDARQLAASKEAIERTAATLASPRRAGDTATLTKAWTFDAPLRPQGKLTQRITGAKAIRRFVVRPQSPLSDAALRGLRLRIAFDGRQTVEAPLGDFFGAAPGANRYESLPAGVTGSGEFWSHWVMPFRDAATVEIVNTTPGDVRLTGEVWTDDYAWDDRRSMYFHADWKGAADVPTRPMTDFNYLTAAGQGAFVGAAFSIDNPTRAWWGEGDEKIYVDGERFPSHFGTGTEDYYGYAWCDPTPFTHAYHAQPRCDGPGNYGRTSVLRWHVIDRIPFTRALRFDMELWHWKDAKVNYATLAFWYGRPGAASDTPPVRDEQLVVRPLPPYSVPKVAGAIEGEAMRVVSLTGKVGPQDWDGLSGESHLWWRGGQKVGDTLTLSFPVPASGQYRVFGRFLKAKDYGVFRLTLDGRPTRPAEFDFYNPEVAPTPEIDLGTFTLRKGETELRATVAGANPNAVRAYMFGLDYLRLEPLSK